LKQGSSKAKGRQNINNDNKKKKKKNTSKQGSSKARNKKFNKKKTTKKTQWDQGFAWSGLDLTSCCC
jgi:hypothetical protein